MNPYTNTDQQLHILSQTIAKANRTFVPKEADDSHTNLAFNASKNRLEGRWINSKQGKIMLSLELTNLEFKWINQDNKILQSIPSLGKTTTVLEREIATELSAIGLDSAGFEKPLHFEIPAYSFAEETFQAISAEAMRSWKNYRKLANEGCAHLLSELKCTSEIRIWPHHFDTGVYIEPSTKIGLGFGLAMEDSMVGNPYFYFSAYGLNGHDFKFPSNVKLKVGKWILNENWKGAVLPLTDLQENDTQKLNFFIAELSQCYL